MLTAETRKRLLPKLAWTGEGKPYYHLSQQYVIGRFAKGAWHLLYSTYPISLASVEKEYRGLSYQVFVLGADSSRIVDVWHHSSVNGSEPLSLLSLQDLGFTDEEIPLRQETEKC